MRVIAGRPEMSSVAYRPRGVDLGRPYRCAGGEPFRSADDAWFWTMAALAARRDGARFTANQGRTIRPCEPDDVVKCLDALYRRRRISLDHVRVLRVWGDRQVSPDPACRGEQGDWKLWREALVRLEWPMRIKGIVA